MYGGAVVSALASQQDNPVSNPFCVDVFPCIRGFSPASSHGLKAAFIGLLIALNCP